MHSMFTIAVAVGTSFMRIQVLELYSLFELTISQESVLYALYFICTRLIYL